MQRCKEGCLSMVRMIVYCIKHRNKYYMYVNPFGILSTQKTDLAKVAVVLFMFLIYSLK